MSICWNFVNMAMNIRAPKQFGELLRYLKNYWLLKNEYYVELLVLKVILSNGMMKRKRYCISPQKSVC
jgi:hypothetical protein